MVIVLRENAMEEAGGPVLSGMKLLGKGWRMYALHVGKYLRLMTFVVLVQVLLSAFAVLVIAPGRPGMNLRQVFVETSTLQRLGITVVFLLSLAFYYRALAASMLATSELSEGREIGAMQAFRRVRWKHTRLFWLMTAGILFGPFAPLVVLIAGFFLAPALPIAVVEDLGAFQALKRGEELGAGNQLRIATMYAGYLVLVTGAVAAIFKVLDLVQVQFGNAWYVKPMPAIGFLIFFTVVQWYMIVLTLNYLEQRIKLAETQLPCA